MKRCIDIVVAIGGLALSLPILLSVWVAVRITVGPPALFVQVRPGLHGRAFRMVKFRTMTQARNEFGALLPDAERLTRLGRFLRATSLDELPELWNVLIGDMSLVGPRPLLMDYLGLYSAEQARRHEVRPGITGWAQVNGRNSVSWEEKLSMDVWYVDNRTLWLDFVILWRTVALVSLRKGISAQGHATMERFKGSGS